MNPRSQPYQGIKKKLDHDVMFINNASSLRLNVNNFNNLIQAAKPKKISLFFIFQDNKTEHFRGSLEYKHEANLFLISDNKKDIVKI